MFTVIVPQLWMMVPKKERDLIAKEFNLSKTGITEVVNEDVITDGYRAEDLAGITIEKMANFIGSEESYMRSWELTVMKAHSLLNPPEVFIGSPDELQEKLMNLKEVSMDEYEKITGTKIELLPPEEIKEEVLPGVTETGEVVTPDQAVENLQQVVDKIKEPKVEKQKEIKKEKNKNV